MTDLQKAIAEHRKSQYTPAGGRIDSVDDAAAFIAGAGFALLSKVDGVELPTISRYVKGVTRPYTEELPASRRAYYGRVFRGRPGFVSMALLPAIYGLSPAADFGGDRFALYSKKLLSEEGHRIAGMVRAQGPISSRALRRALGLASDDDQREFMGRMAEVEGRFLVAQVGYQHEGKARGILWDSFDRHYAEAAAAGVSLTHEAAASSLMTRYLATVGAATVAQIARTFSLHPPFVEKAAAMLVEAGEVAAEVVDGAAQLVANAVMMRLSESGQEVAQE